MSIVIAEASPSQKHSGPKMELRRVCNMIFLLSNIAIAITGVAFVIYGCASSNPNGFFTYSYVGAQVATVGAFYTLVGSLGCAAIYFGRKDLLLTYLHFSGSLLLLRLLDWIFWAIQGRTIHVWYHYGFLVCEILVNITATVLYFKG